MKWLWLMLIPAVALLWELYMVFPSLRRHHGRKELEGTLFAHRGLHDISRGIPENSLSAYRAAAEKGFGIEIDVHITRDGKLVVFHDDTLNRLCGCDGTCEGSTLEELKNLHLQGTGEQIPTLQETLDCVNGRVPLLVELKYAGKGRNKLLCERTAALLDAYSGVYYVQSFYSPALEWFRHHRPKVMRGQLSGFFEGDHSKKTLLHMISWMWGDVLARPDFVSYDIKDCRRFPFRLVRFLGALPVGWTFTTQQELDEKSPEFKAWIFEFFLPGGKES